MDQEKIGKFIAECRKNKKLTQTELASKLGVTEKSISNWENGRNMPSFFIKYLKSSSLLRLRNVGYFCGMDYASKDVYNFSEYISRYDHSLTVSLIVYKLTNNIKTTLAALFHDIAIPCFSHVIDYMNEDYEKQESTEEYTEYILKNDSYLVKCLNEDEIGFKSYDVARKVLEVSESIDVYCHSKEDNYMMQLLARITELAISEKLITYEELYFYDERELFEIFKNTEEKELMMLLNEFENKKKMDIHDIDLPKVKVRCLKLLVSGKRLI